MTRQVTSLVIDRSGSISSCLAEMQKGLDGFVDDRKAGKGKELLGIAQFDTDYEQVVPFTDVKKYVHEFRIKPRGGTALWDAIGRNIRDTENALAGDWAKAKPVVVIVTDGYENSSREFNSLSLNQLITEKRGKGWEFLYLGANQDAVLEAANIGIAAGSALEFSTKFSDKSFRSVSVNLTRGASSGSYAFTEEERTSVA